MESNDMSMDERLEYCLKQAETAYTLLNKSRLELFRDSETVLKLKQELSAKKAQGLSEGYISGKNADEREASAREYMGDVYVALGSAEDELRHSESDYQFSLDRVAMQRFHLRVLELLCRDNE